MTTYGVTAEGFILKSLLEIKAEMEADFQAAFGSSVPLNPESRNGQLLGIFAERLAEVWELAQAGYSAGNPDAATGVPLDLLCALTGTLRLAAVASTGTATLTGTATTVVPAGKVASVAATLDRFALVAPATLVAVTAWAGSTTFTAGDRRKNGGNVYQCTTGGMGAGSGGPTGTGTGIHDNMARWTYLGLGDGCVDATFTAESTGPKNAFSGTLVTIETPYSGWQGVYNMLDFTVGRDIEPDATLRVRRAYELRSSGNAALDAIRAHLLRLDTVTAVTMFENPSDTTDGDGLPPHSFEALINGGVTADIVAAIWASKAAGIRSYGTSSSTLVDSQGTTRTIYFSRPTLKPVYVGLTVTYDALLYPVDGDTQIKAAIVAWGNVQQNGKDVVAAALSAQAFSIAGVLDVTTLISFAVSPTLSVTLAVGLRELATYDTSRITVASSPGTP